MLLIKNFHCRILQVQEKLRRDLETELMSTQDQVQDGTPRSTILLELQRSSVERLPCLKHVAAASWTSTGTTRDRKPSIYLTSILRTH